MNNLQNKYNRIIIILFAIAPFFGYFLYTFLAITFYKVMVIFSFLGVALLLLFRNHEGRIVFPRYLLFYLLFVVYLFVSDLIFLKRAFKLVFILDNKFLGTFLILFIIENLYVSKKFYETILKISKIVLFIAIAVLAIQEAIDPHFFMRPEAVREELYTSKSVQRLYSIYTYTGGLILACGYGFVPIYIWFVEDLNRRNKQIILWILLGAIFAFFTRQRWLMVYYSLIFFIIIAGSRNKTRDFLKYSVLVPVVFVGAFLAMNVAGLDTKKILEDRILESDKGIHEKSAGTRLLAFKAFNQLYWDNPLFGVGNIKYGMGGTGEQDFKLKRILRGHSSQIHVGYLSLLYMYGFVGFILFTSFLGSLLLKLYRDANKTRLWAPFLVIVGFSLNNFTEVTFQIFEMGTIIVLAMNQFFLIQYKRSQSQNYA